MYFLHHFSSLEMQHRDATRHRVEAYPINPNKLKDVLNLLLILTLTFCYIYQASCLSERVLRNLAKVFNWEALATRKGLINLMGLKA